MKGFFPKGKKKEKLTFHKQQYFTIFSGYVIISLIYNKQWTLMAASDVSISLAS